MAKPTAGDACIGKWEPGVAAKLINLITSIQLIKPKSREPVSPIKILAGEKL